MTRSFSLSFITFLLIFQQKPCTAEPLTLISAAVTSGIMGIIDLVSHKPDKVIEEDRQNVVKEFINYNIQNQLIQTTKSIIQSIDESNDKQTLNQLLRELSEEVFIIENWYNDMIHYNKTNSNKTAQEVILPQAKERVLNQEDGSRFHLNKIYSLFLSSKQHILKLLDNLKKGFKNTCSIDNSLQSVQQMNLKLYSLVTLAGAKAYQTILTAAELLRKYEPGSSYERAVKDAERDIISKQNKIGRRFKYSLKVSSREVWRCDPKHHYEDKTFIELKNIFKKHVIYENGFKESDGYCKPSCKDYKNPVTTKIFCGFSRDKETCNRMAGCKGNLWDCDNTFKLDTSQVLDICYTTSGSDRRFDYGEKRNKSHADAIIDHYGHQKTCTGLNQRQFNITLQGCELCTCTCEENSRPNSDEFISLEPAFSNINENRVVTGARLVRKNNTIRIEIQEGILGPMATIVKGNVSWVSNNAPRPTTNDVLNYKVYKIQWNGRRQFTLTDLKADEGSVVVGLQFGMNPEHPEYGVTIILHTKAFDFQTGKLLVKQYKKQFYASEELSIEDLDIPTLAPGKSVALRETDKCIKLTTTGMKQDFGQTIVPFLDIQEVTTTIPTPMSGIGLYYKRYEGYGGFLGLKLFTYDFLKHFNSKISKGNNLKEN